MEIYKIWKKRRFTEIQKKRKRNFNKRNEKMITQERQNFRKGILMEMNINQDITFLYREGYCIW